MFNITLQVEPGASGKQLYVVSVYLQSMLKWYKRKWSYCVGLARTVALNRSDPFAVPQQPLQH